MKVKLVFIFSAFIIMLFLVSCGIKEERETTVPTEPHSTAVPDSVAVSVFLPMTEAAEDNETQTVYDYFTNLVTTEEKISELVNNQITTKQQDEAVSTKPVTIPTTTEKPTTAKPTTQAARQTVTVRVNEGDSLTQIFKKLDESGVADFDALMETAQDYDYSYYPLVAGIPSNANRCFRLEGYLFPDTYEFYTNQKPQDAIGKFLRNGKAKITDSMVSQASALGYTIDEVITVASIIEKEGAKSSEISKIAAVIYNRLENGMKLQMDSTIYYIERHVKPYLTGDINRFNSYYNTYKCSALPAGPISNPGLRTINAALNPADVPYLYFCHDENANYYYAETFEEHQQNLKKAGIE